MSDEVNKTPVGATVTNVNGKATSTIWLRGDEIGAPGATYPDGSSPNPSKLGCVKAGTNITIDADGTINASGTIGTDWSAVSNKPFKTVGSGLTVDGSGALNVTGGGGSTDWSQITNKPTAFPPTPANGTTLGGVKAGANITIAADGTISATGSLGTDWSQITNKPATFTPPIADASTLGGVKKGAGIEIGPDGTISTTATAPTWNEVQDKPAVFPPPIAATNVLGGVKQGAGVKISGDGTLSTDIQQVDWDIIVDKPAAYPPVIATETTVGGVKPGNNISIDPDGTINAAAIDLPIASTYLLGGVKVGAGLTIAEDGTLGTESSAPYWGDIVDRPKAFPPTNASEGIVGGIMPDDQFSIDPDGMIHAKPFKGTPFALLSYDGYGNIAGSTTASYKNGNLVLGGSAPTINEDGSVGEEVSFAGQITLLDQTGAYQASIRNDSFDYNLILTNGPNVKAGFLPFVTEVDSSDVKLAFGPPKDAIGYATKSGIGLVQVGGNIDVDKVGVVSVKTADKDNLGVVRVGGGIDVKDGLITPSLATNASPGIVQVGEGLSVDANGVISTTNAIAFVNVKKFVGVYGDSGFEWDLPEGVDYFRVTCIGPGGHGGARDTGNLKTGIGGGGGGAGGFVQAMFRGYKYAPGTKFAIQVGGSGYNVQGDIFKHASYIAVKGDKPIIGGLGGEAGQSYNDADPVKDGLTRGGVGGKAYTGGVDVGLVTVTFAADGDHGDAGYSLTTNAGVAMQIGGSGGVGIYSGSGNGVTNIGFGGGGCGAGINIDKASTAGFKEFPGVVIVEW